MRRTVSGRRRLLAPTERDGICNWQWPDAWHEILEIKATAWNIPACEVTDLDALITTTADCLQTVQSTDRTAVSMAQCKEAFDALIARMRVLKSHYFLTPPLKDEDSIALELKPHDTSPTPVPPPTAQVEADRSRPGVHLRELHLLPPL
jgi:hypothetical protein